MATRAHGILLIVALLGLLITSGWGIAAPARAKTALQITAPASQAVANGPLTFTVQVANLPADSSIEYRLNGQPLGGPTAVPPYSFAWHSGLQWDGPATIQAIARDADGAVIAESPVVSFTINNLGGSLRLLSPDLTQVLHGKVKWAMEGDRALTDDEKAKLMASQGFLKTTEALVHFLDGRLVYLPFGNSKTSYDLDTTKLANGKHELLVTAWAFKSGIPPYGMLQAPITVDNGHTVRDVRPKWRTLFLAPGKTATLAPRLIYTDSTEEPLTGAAAYTSADTKVATVDAGGVVSALAPGITTITLEAQGCKTTTRVIVDKPHGFPHFSRDGHILTEYDPAHSLFVRTLFNLGPDSLPAFDAPAHAAAINTLTTGFYRNPADGSNPKDFDTWKRGWEPWWNGIAQQATEHDFSLLLTGDDIARTANELNNSVTNPWAPEAIGYAFTKARDSKRVVCVEMVDEISFLWGSTPTPTDGRWQKQQPPLPDDAFIKLMKSINAVTDRPPLSWPIGGISGPDAAQNWMGNPAFADYTSHYWDVLDWRRAFPDHASLPQNMTAMDRAAVDRLPVVQRDKPALLLMSICSLMYTKPPAGEVTPDDYRLQGYDVPSADVSTQVMYAAAMGMAGVRAYAFDTWWSDERKRAKPGEQCQVGASPFGVGSDRWQAMSSAFNLIKRLEPHLLQPQINAIDLGPTIVTGARQGKDSRLLMAVNFSQTAEPVRVDLTPYRYTDGASIIRYRLCGATLRTDILPNGNIDSVTFAPGETVVWLCRPAPARKTVDVTPPEVVITSPLPNETLAGKVTIRITATDNVKVDHVTLLLDGAVMSSTKVVPFAVTWDLSTVKADIWHTISAVAYDTAGNTSEERIAIRPVAPAQK